VNVLVFPLLLFHNSPPDVFQTYLKGLQQIIWNQINPRHLSGEIAGEFGNDPSIGWDFMLANFVDASILYFTGVLRLGLSLVFAVSFSIQPLLIRPISLLWLRVVQSNKPVFTLVLGGIGTLATTFNEALKHL
jgi:hypothetical protein